MDNSRSLESRTKSPVKFINKTGKDIEIFWLDFSGKEFSYGRIHSSESSALAINSFVTHPWIAKDCSTGQRLWLNGKEIFLPPQPRTARIIIGVNREQLIVKRACVLITLPVFNVEKLFDLCCCAVSETSKPEDIEKLPLPNFITRCINQHHNKPES